MEAGDTIRDMSTIALAASPFDPYLYRMLSWAVQQPSGFSHPAIIRAMADEAGWQAPFAEAVFTSARVRGLIGPHYGTRSRGRVYWQVSRKGGAWLEAKTRTNDSVIETPSHDSAGAASAESADPT
jgi:hypothetical protein